MSSRTLNEPSISLNFVIVGGGIGGLATAYTLKRAGHSVVVLDKRDIKAPMSFGRYGGTIRAPPNMTRLLYRWGLGPVLKEKSNKCDRITYINGNTAVPIGSLGMNEEFLKSLIADIVLIQHGDLVNILYNLAFREGVVIRHNANVIHADPDCTSVRLDTGEIISGDIIIVADGYSSSLRTVVTGYGQDTDLESDEKVLVVAFSVETSLLENDKSFKPVLEPTQWITWMAERTIVHTYIVGKQLVGTLSYDYSGYRPSREGDEEWSDSRDLESYGLDFASLEPRLQKILKLAHTIASRTFSRRPVPDDLVNDRASMALVGEAAHPLVSEGSHCTAMVIEDAETLGSLFSRIQCREQINQLLMAYEEIRHPRCVRTYEQYRRLDAAMKYPIGPQQGVRDAIIHRSLAYDDWNHMDEVAFITMWGNLLSGFAYDASEAVDDWWCKWGPFIQLPGTGTKCKLTSAPLQVWISRG